MKRHQMAVKQRRVCLRCVVHSHLIAVGATTTHMVAPAAIEAVKGTVYFHVLEAVLMTTPLYPVVRAWYAFWTGDHGH